MQPIFNAPEESDEADMAIEPWHLYGLMLKSRLFEEAIAKLWHEGMISGEMHLGTGEEAIIAGVVAHLRDGDAMALDHRSSAALLMRGVDPVLILSELLGYQDGLCGGMGGHMHLFSREHLAASSGIVGAAGPAATGFALAGQFLRPKTIAVAFFGEGAMNQGMLMESLNLASVWKLPVLFVCKNDGWQITTQSEHLTGRELIDRAQGLGVPAFDVDGCDVSAMWETAGNAIERLRTGQGPIFLHARCVHLEGHFLGFQLIRILRNPVKELIGISGPMAQSFLRFEGADLQERLAGLRVIMGAVLSTLRDPRRDLAGDPLRRARKILQAEPARLQELELRIEEEISNVIASALAEVQA
jgi:acetoin:2,6-dichlorophenolindophenol oxidoreductase subunit alpha